MTPNFPTGPPSPQQQQSFTADLTSQFSLPTMTPLPNPPHLSPQFPVQGLQTLTVSPAVTTHLQGHPTYGFPHPGYHENPHETEKSNMDVLETQYGNRIHVKNIKKNYKLLIQSDTSCVTVELPERHAIHFYPNLILGRSPPNGTANNDYHTEEFIVRLRYEFPFTLDLEKIQKTLRLELRNEAATMLVYDSTRLAIQKEGNVVSLIVEAHSITLPNQYACKEINGRSDGMKRNVQEFLKKRRNLQVSFTDDERDYFFSCNVICCASSSFHNALKPYRDEAAKIKELFLFLWKELPNPFFIVEPTPPDSNRGGYFERIKRHSQLAARQLAGTSNKKPRAKSQARSLDRSQEFSYPQETIPTPKRKRPELPTPGIHLFEENPITYYGIDPSVQGVPVEYEGGEIDDGEEDYQYPPYKKQKPYIDEGSVDSIGTTDEVLPLIKEYFNEPTKPVDPTSAELFQKNFDKIKKTFEETKALVEASGHPESERILSEISSVFAFAIQYSFECLLQNKNVLKL